MFKGLRLRLTLTYAAAALALVLLMGFGTFGLLRFYFQADNDSALRYRLAQEFERVGAGLPADLLVAKLEWESRHGDQGSTSAGGALPPGIAKKSVDEPAGSTDEGAGPPWAGYPDAELLPVYVLRLDAKGGLVLDTPSEETAATPILEAYVAAAGGSDLRTTTLADGRRVRVATYRLPAVSTVDGAQIAYVQAGRLLGDQDRVLNQILLTVLLACGGAVFAVGLASWYFAGRSLGPARKAWEQQQVFVANASHELRTPVTLIRASAEYALRTEHAARAEGPSSCPAELNEALEDVVAEADHLSRLVDDLVLLSRLDASKLDVGAEPITVGDLLSEVDRSFARLADGKGVSFSIGSGGDAAALGDRTRLRQVLLIVLDNALRHTPPEGSISIECRSAGRRVLVVVSDTGAGISADDLPHVFERFYQAPASRAEGRGSGLGLAIAKALMEAQKGKIEVSSRPGEGTQVTITLPAAEPRDAGKGHPVACADTGDQGSEPI